MRKILAIGLLALSLSGCGWFTKHPDATMPPKEKVVRLDPGALTFCDSLKRIPAGSTQEEITSIDLDNFGIYADCANKQKNSVKLLKEFSNYKEPK